MDIAPAQMLLLGQGALLGSFSQHHDSHGHSATGQPRLWVWLQGEMWSQSGFDTSLVSTYWQGSPKSVGLC